MSTQIKVRDVWYPFPTLRVGYPSGREMVKVICGFPGVGKSRAASDDGFLDSDSSLFSWSAPHVRNPEFPVNYIAHIKAAKQPVLASTHDTVLAALTDAKVRFILCYPEQHCLDEYVSRYSARGSPPKFIELLRENWSQWLDDLAKNKEAAWHIVLRPGEYLSDYVRAV